MIELRDKKFIIDGKAVIIVSGEIHYYRLPVEEWRIELINLLLLDVIRSLLMFLGFVMKKEKER